MNGSNILADTSLLINFFNGKRRAKEFLEDKDIWISTITEIEILVSSKISEAERKIVRRFLNQISIIELINPIKEIAINLRIAKTLKLPDAIIAASAIYLDFPLITYDKAFSKVNDLNLLLLEN